MKDSLPRPQNLPMVPILMQKNPVPTLSPYIFKIHFNIILPSTSRSSICSLSYRFSDHNSLYISDMSLPGFNILINQYHHNLRLWCPRPIPSDNQSKIFTSFLISPVPATCSTKCILLDLTL